MTLTGGQGDVVVGLTLYTEMRAGVLVLMLNPLYTELLSRLLPSLPPPLSPSPQCVPGRPCVDVPATPGGPSAEEHPWSGEQDGGTHGP